MIIINNSITIFCSLNWFVSYKITYDSTSSLYTLCTEKHIQNFVIRSVSFKSDYDKITMFIDIVALQSYYSTTIVFQLIF